MKVKVFLCSMIWLLVSLVLTEKTVAASVHCNITENAYNSLKSLHITTHGSYWIWNPSLPLSTQWAFPSPLTYPCTNGWQGLECTLTATDECSITVLDLRSYNLTGILPVEIGQLTNLKNLSLANNSLYGEIPSTIGNMKELVDLSLRFNYLNSTIPDTIFEIPTLVSCDLASNHLLGPMPLTLSSSKTLQVLDLEFNVIGDILPEYLGNVTTLKIANFEGNKFHGSIPSGYGKLTNLVLFDVARNNLEFTIPASFNGLHSIQQLILSGNSFGGRIPDIGSLLSLQIFDLSKNLFTGPFPTTLCHLPELLIVNLNYNQLQGNIPGCIGNMTSLMSLYVISNHLNGSVPTEIGLMASLTLLDISDNLLRHNLPTEMGKLTKLDLLWGFGNQFNSVLPTEFGNLSSISSLKLYDNHLSGPIPTTLGKLRKIVDLQLDINSFTGPIPSELGQCSSLGRLFLDYNLLTGTIIDDFKHLRYLYGLNLEYNYLNGTLPSIFTRLSSLETLNLNHNVFEGNISGAFCNCSNLTSLYLESNSFSGPLPSCLGSIVGLTNVFLANNAFVGTLPDSYRNWAEIQQLDISYNKLTGDLPSVISSWSSVVELYLNNNLFQGTIPASISNATGLGVLDISFNAIVGSIPTELGLLTRLQYMNFSNAELVGHIPEAFGAFHRLQVFDLNTNTLSGTIPANIGVNLGLKFFSLSYNSLTGPLPEELTKNPSLVEFEVGNNLLSGRNPLELGVGPSLVYLVLSNNLFTGSLPANWSRYKNLEFVYYDNNLVTGSLPYILLDETKNYVATSLIELSIWNNFLSGTIPSALCSHSELTLLAMSNNLLEGSLPAELSELSLLNNFDISSNAMTGPLTSAFSLPFRSLQYVNLANNTFHGTLPDQLFNSTALEVVTLSSNCFSGPIPESICISSRLVSVIMDSLCTGSSCAANIPPLINDLLKGVFPKKKMEGGIPNCLWSLPNLQGLQLAGNGLVGSLPEGVPTASLNSLQLSYNALTGTIPELLQTRGNFLFLSLQHNKLTGTLIENFNMSVSVMTNNESQTTTLYLDVNRLSGNVPQSILSIDTISILTGNLFFCTDSNELPSQDPSSWTYVCGSDQLNTALYAWISLFGAVLLLMLLFFFIVWTLVGNSVFSNPTSEAINTRLRETLAPLSATPRSLTAQNKPDLRVIDQDEIGKAALAAASPFDRTFSISSSTSSRQLSVDNPLTPVDLQSDLLGTNSELSSSLSQNQRPSQLDATARTIRIFLKTTEWLSFNYSSRRNYLVNTSQFLEVIWRASKCMFRLSVVYLSLVMSAFILVKTFGDDYSTLSHQYGWIITSSFLHGYLPGCFMLLVLVCSLSYMIYSIRTDALSSLANMRSVAREKWNATKYYSGYTIPTWAQLNDYFLNPLFYHLINIIVSVAANAVYVSVLRLIGPEVILFFQASMSLFKLTWANTFIPLAMRRMKVLPTSVLLRHQVAMLIFDYIIGPGLASAGADSNCFFPAIVGSGTVTSNYNVLVTEQVCETSFEFIPTTINVEVANTTVTCKFLPIDVASSAQTTPPFIYGYQCGSSFLVDYVPVLLYSYLFSALVLPLFRFIVLQLPRRIVKSAFPGMLYQLIIADTLLDCDDDIIDSIQEARTISAGPKVDEEKRDSKFLSKVDSTCGDIRLVTRDRVISGGDGMSVFVSGSRQSAVKEPGHDKPLFDGMTVIAKRLLDFSVLLTFGLACPVLGLGVAFSVFTNAVVWRLMIGKFLSSVGENNTYAFFRLEKSSEGLVRGAVAGLSIAVLSVCVFWSVMLFDMIADLHGGRIGMIFVLIVLLVVPFCLYFGFTVYDWWRYGSSNRRVSTPVTITSPIFSDSKIDPDDILDGIDFQDGNQRGQTKVTMSTRAASVDIWSKQNTRRSTMAEVDHNSEFL